MTWTVVTWIGLFACLVLSGAYSGLEAGLYATSRLRIVLDAAAGRPAARRLQRLLSDLPRLLVVLLLANNLVNWAISFLTQVVLAGAGVRGAEVLGTLLVSVVLFVLGESAPKMLFREGQHDALYRAMPLLDAAWALLSLPARPLAIASGWVAGHLPRPPGLPPESDEVLRAGAAEGFLSPFQQRVARGILSMRARTAAEEADPVDSHPVARLGQAGVRQPPGRAGHRVLVLEEDGRRIAGWVPLARLAHDDGFRAPIRRELSPVARVAPETGLERVYTVLDRTGAPFAVLTGDGPARVVEANRLRRRVMGTFEGPVASSQDPT